MKRWTMITCTRTMNTTSMSIQETSRPENRIRIGIATTRLSIAIRIIRTCTIDMAINSDPVAVEKLALVPFIGLCDTCAEWLQKISEAKFSA